MKVTRSFLRLEKCHPHMYQDIPTMACCLKDAFNSFNMVIFALGPNLASLAGVTCNFDLFHQQKMCQGQKCNFIRSQKCYLHICPSISRYELYGFKMRLYNV